MNTLKIKFVDFWFGFEPNKNFFFKILSKKYKIEISDNPEILIYSCYSFDYLKYNCLKIFYSAENLRPDFTGCDYAITFDYNHHPRHYRLPLYALYIDQIGTTERLLQKKTKEEALKIWRSKSKFCCMVVSNGRSKKRLQFFRKLSEFKRVDSGGSILNNVDGPVKNKMDFIKDYRFVIAFENASYPGYTTEKIIEPFLADSIPLYWGNPVVNKDFNPGSFLNLSNFKSIEDFIKEIAAIENDEKKAIEMLVASKFAGGITPSEIEKKNLLLFFEKAINDSYNLRPVAQRLIKYLHLYKVKKKRSIIFVKTFGIKITNKFLVSNRN